MTAFGTIREGYFFSLRGKYVFRTNLTSHSTTKRPPWSLYRVYSNFDVQPYYYAKKSRGCRGRRKLSMYPSDPTTIRRVDWLMYVSRRATIPEMMGDSRDVHKHKYSHSATCGGPDLLDAGNACLAGDHSLANHEQVKNTPPEVSQNPGSGRRAASGSTVEGRQL